MKNLIITCHVEPLQKVSDITYLDDFFKKSKFIKFPIIYLLMYGERAGGRILARYHYDHKFGLHIHNETRLAFQEYKKYFGSYPRDISFGHWNFDKNDLITAEKFGVKRDYSYSAYKSNDRYFFKQPFKIGGIIEYPATCDPVLPLTPITLWKHFFMVLVMLPLIKLNGNIQLHFSFHSYDIY